jgi:4-amino-4-deoxy-L-arabinose transferase-like glycosyltransferase
VLSRRDVVILEWRPADLAAIALNYYRNGFDFLHPQILWGGTGPGYVEMEFPLLPYSMALLYSVFGVHDWVALTIPILCGIGLAVVVNKLTTHFFGAAAGFFAGLFVATTPTWLAMSTGLWPDAPPVFFGALGLYQLARWIDDGSNRRFVVAGCLVSLAILLKLTSLYLGLPVLFLFWVKYRERCFGVPRLWFFAMLVLIPPVLWYAHAYRLYLHYENTFGIIASGYMKFGNTTLFGDPRFYAKTFLRVVLFHTTPLGFVLMVIGIWRPPDRPAAFLFHVWLAAVLIYFIVAAQGVYLGHYQYALPIVPPAAALAGRGLVLLLRRLEFERPVGIPGSSRAVAFAALALLTVNAIASNYVLEARGMDFRKLSLEKMRTGKALAGLASPGDLVVVVDADMDDRVPQTSMTPPEVFYFSDRRGWYRSMAWLTPEAIEDLRRQGARYLAVSANHARWFRRHYAALYDSCSRRYRTLVDGDDGIIYDLGAPVGSATGR